MSLAVTFDTFCESIRGRLVLVTLAECCMYATRKLSQNPYDRYNSLKI